MTLGNVTRMAALLAAIGFLLPAFAMAAPFEFLRIGDFDGFGETDTSALINAVGGPADTDGDNLLEIGEFLPNRAGDSSVNPSDPFDNQSAAEAADTALNGIGFSDRGSSGASWTDRSVDTIGNPAVFIFDFRVAAGDVDPSSDVFFNLVFGDLGVNGDVRLTFADETSRETQVTRFQDQGGQNLDGLIDAATATLGFSEVFTATPGGYDAYVMVEFLPQDVYIAFDFAELSISAVVEDDGVNDPQPDAEPIPAPGAAWLLTLLPGLLAARRRFGRGC